jgi:hypothetical protein
MVTVDPPPKESFFTRAKKTLIKHRKVLGLALGTIVAGKGAMYLAKQHLRSLAEELMSTSFKEGQEQEQEQQKKYAYYRSKVTEFIKFSRIRGHKDNRTIQRVITFFYFNLEREKTLSGVEDVIKDAADQYTIKKDKNNLVFFNSTDSEKYPNLFVGNFQSHVAALKKVVEFRILKKNLYSLENDLKTMPTGYRLENDERTQEERDKLFNQYRSKVTEYINLSRELKLYKDIIYINAVLLSFVKNLEKKNQVDLGEKKFYIRWVVNGRYDIVEENNLVFFKPKTEFSQDLPILFNRDCNSVVSDLNDLINLYETNPAFGFQNRLDI